MKNARLRVQATLEDIDLKHPRKLDQSLLRALSSGTWIREKSNILLSGPTGVGKTFIACGLAHTGCRQGFTALYVQMGRLLSELVVQRGDGRYRSSLKRLAKVQVLVLDDWGLDPLGALERRVLLDVLDDRYERSSTVIASQLPIETWYDTLAAGDPTLADAILDRILHGAYRLELMGESLRKTRRKEADLGARA